MSELKLPPIPSEAFNSWPPEAQEYVATLQRLFEQLLIQNQQLLAQNKELLNRLNQNSQNSSKPPSQDPPFKRPPKKPTGKSGRPKGGQVGHPKHERPLLPPEQVDQTIEFRPTECANPHCHSPLKATDQVGEPLRHQVWELPQLKAEVKEYQFHTYECSLCQTKTIPQWPAEVPKSQFGPHLTATLAVLHGHYQLSLRQVQQAAQELWQLPLSLGAVAEACRKTSQALEPAYQEVAAHLPNSHAVHLDETGWYRAGKLKWLWVAVAPLATLFRISPGRGRAELKELLGESYQGFVHSDRLRAYLSLEERRHQLCWAHLIRNLRGLSQRAGPAGEWGQGMLGLSDQIFERWHRFLDSEGQLDRQWLEAEVTPLRAAFKAGLERGESLGDGKVKSFSRALLKLEERLYLFVKEEGVAPTNNTAERALRPAVIWRKKCYGNQSTGGEEFVERVLSVQATCRQQGRHFLSFVKECLSAKWLALPTPQLIPVTSSP